jgi:excisionase family DNA binding protein
MEPQLITTHTAAALIGVSVATVKRLVAAGELPTAHKLEGRTGAHLFTREAVTAYAAKRNAA